MRLPVAVAALVGAAAGTAVAVTGYQSTASVPARPTARPVPVGDGAQLPYQPRPQYRIRLAGCHPPARLEHGTCVTRMEHTVVVHDPAQPAGHAPAPAASSVTPPAPAPSARPGPGAPVPTPAPTPSAPSAPTRATTLTPGGPTAPAARTQGSAHHPSAQGRDQEREPEPGDGGR